jgi:hypothetical protein
VIFEGEEGEAALRANSSGVKYRSAECGLCELYSTRQAAIFARASNRFQNQLTFKHSSRSRPLKLSMNAFCVGLPGWM